MMLARTSLAFALAVLVAAPGCATPAPTSPARFTPPGRAIGGDRCAVLTPGSTRLVQGLRQPMVIEAFVTRGDPKLDAFAAGLEALLQQYEGASEGKVRIEMLDATASSARARAEDAGLVKIDFGETGGAARAGYMGLVFTYGAERDSIKALAPDNVRGLEFWVSNKVREIRDRAEGVRRRIGVLVGHDEPRLSDPMLLPSNLGQKPNLQGILTQHFPFYRFEDVDLRGGQRDVDDGLDGVLVLQPDKDVSEQELRRLDAFVLKGKSLAIVASAVNLAASDPSGATTLTTHGLDKLTSGYGIGVHDDVVVDFERQFAVEVMTAAGPQRARFPTLLDIQDDARFTGETQLLDPTFPAFFRIPQVSLPFASSIEIHPERQPAAKLRVVARSSPKSESRRGKTLSLPLLQRWTAGKNLAQFAVAAAIEGKLRSAFGPPGEGKAPSRVLVIASSQLFVNPFVRAGDPPDKPGDLLPEPGDDTLQSLGQSYAQSILTNQILVTKNLLDWMTGDGDLVAASAKVLPSPSCGGAKR